MKAYGTRQSRKPAAHDQNSLGGGFHFSAGIAMFNALFVAQKKPQDENPAAFFLNRGSLAQERLVQTTVDGDDLPGGLA
jgi:hypothetical protein